MFRGDYILFTLSLPKRAREEFVIVGEKSSILVINPTHARIAAQIAEMFYCAKQSFIVTMKGVL
jgi:hypothetical protein